MVYVTPALPSKASSSGTSIASLASLPFLLTGDLFSSGLDLSRCGTDTVFTLPAPPGHGLSPAGSGDEGCDRFGPRLDSTPGQTLPVASPGPRSTALQDPTILFLLARGYQLQGSGEHPLPQLLVTNAVTHHRNAPAPLHTVRAGALARGAGILVPITVWRPREDELYLSRVMPRGKSSQHPHPSHSRPPSGVRDAAPGVLGCESTAWRMICAILEAANQVEAVRYREQDRHPRQPHLREQARNRALPLAVAPPPPALPPASIIPTPCPRLRGWHGPCSETLMAPGVITLLAPSTGSQERCLWTHCCGNCLGKRKLTDESFSTHSCNSTSVTRAIGNQPAVCGAMIENGMKLRPEHRCVQSELGCARRHLVIEAYCAAYCLGERNLCRATNQWPEVPEPCFRGFERNRCPWDRDAESKRNKFQ
ncbi:hypothetical protein MG293_019263 [Ovis ammon polii]|uniref:Uncharacterized protein n=1 Tax=Ovis ammon polii TaxID=230172 RepID=A0AAD4TQE2_OVIAM|nr:hypothetical protein MG293_019263 [Ovis ammon polii]